MWNRSFQKYVNKLKAADDAIGNENDYGIEDIIDEMIEEDYTIKEIYDFLIQNYDDYYIPRILQGLYEQGERDEADVYPYYKPSLLSYVYRTKDIFHSTANGQKKIEVMIDLMFEMAIYYTLGEIYEFLVLMLERYDFFYIGDILFSLYKNGFK